MLSYARGPAATVLRQTIGATFLETAARVPNQLALASHHQAIQLTWSDLAHEAQRAAAGLRALGLQAGDRVGLWSTNSVEWVVLQLGCALAGVLLVNLNPAYRTHEISFVLRRSGMKAIFLIEQDSRANYRRILDESIRSMAEPIPLRHIVHIGSAEWHGFLSHAGGAAAWDGDPDEPINMQYTSGTTGMPKGVLLTHVNLVNNGRFTAEYLRITDGDRICVPVPLFHCFGSVIGVMTAIATGAAILLPAASFDPLATLETVQEYRATAIYGVPAMFIAELHHPEFERFDLTSLRTGVMAGAPCPIHLMKQVTTRMHCPQMMAGFGQTESSPVITMSRVDDSIETRCTTVGRPLPETEVRIVSPVTGETAPVGEQGELLTRGYLVMKGYDGEPEATAKAIDSEGWLHTGDLATMRADGYFHITGRARDMIIRGGENIYPREIEEFLHAHPKVSDVHVVGLPDERLGETVLAWIRLKAGESATEDEIRDYCRESLAYFKVPQYVRFVDSFPMTLSGKIQKYKIRQQEIAERGLDAVAGSQTA